MDENKITAEELLERVERMSREMTRLKNAIIAAVSQGTPFNEAFNEELYMESRQDEKKGKGFLSRMMEHLLKIKYCTNDMNYDHWRGEINGFRAKALDITEWKNKKRDTNLINYFANNLDDIYDVAVGYYKDDAKEYTDLREGVSLIPEECPWSLDELMDDSIAELLEKLPNPD